MKLHTKFILLTIGIVVIPIIVGMAVTVFQFFYIAENKSLLDLTKTKRWIKKELPAVIERNDLSVLENIIPEIVDLLVLDDQNKVLFSTVSLFKQNIIVPDGRIFEYISENSTKYEFQILRNNYNNPESRYFIIQIPEIKWLTSVPGAPYFGPAVLLSVLIFLSVMLASVTHSIRKSIQTLENATRRIAQGDLDFEIDAHGNDDIASLTRSFNAMRIQVKEEYARRARFLMGVSHDLKTPLALIEGYADAIQDGYADKPEKLEKYVSIIKNESFLLEARIAHLIDLIKLDTGEWKITHKEVELKYFLEGLGRRFVDDAGILGYNFKYTINLPHTIKVSMDPDLIIRALENLINNAIRYSDKTSPVHLTAELKEDQIGISICNCGIGISKEEMRYIFEPFFRGDNSNKEQGFGLGLATVKSIIRSHGWDIDAESGEKTIFTIRIKKISKGE